MTLWYGLGSITLLRLQAELLLKLGEMGAIQMTSHECEVLERIVVAPKEEDRRFLGGFDERLKGIDFEKKPRAH